MLHLTDQTFHTRVLDADRPVAVLYWQEGCSPCADVKDEMALLERTYAGQLLVCTAEKSAAPAAHRARAGHGVPTVVLYHDGLEVWRRRGGSVTARSVHPWVDDLLAPSPAR